MKKLFKTFLLIQYILFMLVLESYAQIDTLRVMTYNTLDFPLSSSGREDYFRTVTHYLKADVIMVNELSNSTGADILLNQALNEYGITYYNKANFVYGSNLNNLLYYNSEKLSLKSQYEISTNVRDINEYVLYYNSDDLATTNDTIFFYFYVAHLKASQGYEADRLEEVNQFLSRLNAIPDAENIFFCGDFNIYTSSEPAYQALINNTPYNLNDPLPAEDWHNNPFYSLIHTQSTRLDQLGGGSTGGLDDRFDFILFSDDVLSGTNKVEYISNTCEAFGNDGNHFNDSLTDLPLNANIPDSVTYALYYMSDHLPVIADFRVEANIDTTIADIIITEIMYNPPEGGIDSLEFIELYNNGNEIVNLGGYQFAAGVEFEFPSVTISPDQFLVIAVSSVAMQNVFGVSSLQWSSGGLSNDGEIIELINSSGLTIDIVSYGIVSPWPTEPDGYGPSLVLCDPNSDNSLGSNWTASQYFAAVNNNGDTIFATPGFSECGFPPVAAITANQTNIFIGESISFTDLSTNNPTSWLWTFEGGTPATSTDQNPTVTYNTAGIFDVSLIVINSGGTDETIAVDYITVTEETTGDLMVTEIMQNPSSVLDENGEWFEVFNPTNSPIDMYGWYIKDNDIDSIKILSSLIVPANGFVTLGLKSDLGINGNYVCDYEYSNFFIANGADEIVLFNPYEEEIDRVEYDGGLNWPDPNGASMIFTGSETDDNNSYQNWDVAALRELSYFGTTYTDLGSPGTNGTGQNVVIPGLELDLKVYLEGPFNGIDMNTDLNSNLVMPLSQPFNIAPWNYSGTESVASIPNANVVDWVLVELRDAPDASSATSGTMIEQQTAFLLNNGSIVGLNGLSLLSFNHSIVQSLFVVIWHRNHLGIISHYPLNVIAGIYNYDFTTLADQVLGNLTGYKEIVPGIYGMVGGDGYADGMIDLLDKTITWEEQTGNTGYLEGDYNLDSQVTNKDKNDIWKNNADKTEQVPD